MADRLNVFLSKGNLHEVFQSAYNQFYSTESALLRVKMTYLGQLIRMVGRYLF